MISLQDILSARERIAGKVHRTPLLSATRLGAPHGVSLANPNGTALQMRQDNKAAPVLKLQHHIVSGEPGGAWRAR